MTEFNEFKRGRGRPKGASRLNGADSLTLSKIADLIVANPMRPTTAMRRLSIYGEADTRRLQRKWKKSGPQCLEAAKKRRQNAILSSQHVVTSLVRGVRDVTSYLAPAVERLQEYMNSPNMHRLVGQARAFVEGPQFQRMQELANSPAIKQLLEKMDDPKFREQIEQMQRAAYRFSETALNHRPF
ncbi:hypothetical protein [Microvirga flavescens]|uniref:hypothetical protein n=1 Tax=Microvirga flavescens TaxID=2249811 RepID=UPI000DD85570|nr:hypothetical protein [Microvirga flavescens]